MLVFFDSILDRDTEIALIKKISRAPRPQLLIINNTKFERNTIHITDNRTETQYFDDGVVEIIINTERINRKLYCCRYPEYVYMVGSILIMMNPGDEPQTYSDSTEDIDCSWIVIVNLNSNICYILGINDIYCDDGTILSKTMEFLDPGTYIEEMPPCSYLLDISGTRGQSLKDTVMRYNSEHKDLVSKLKKDINERAVLDRMNYFDVVYFNEFFRIVSYEYLYSVYLNNDVIYDNTDYIVCTILYSDNEYIVLGISVNHNVVIFIDYTGHIIHRLDGNVNLVMRNGRRFYCELLKVVDMEESDIGNTEYTYIDL